MRKSVRRSTLLAAAAVAGLSMCHHLLLAAIPITLTADTFNANAVVNTTPVTASTYLGVDTENGISFWGPGYSSSNALPASGLFNSSINSQTQFQLQPYSGDTAMLINADSDHTSGGVSTVTYAPAYGQTGAITFATPKAYSTIALLDTASIQNGASSFQMNYTLNFSDGTASYNNSGSASFTAYDWSSGSSTALGSLGRVWVQGGNLGNAAGTNWTLHETDITIPSAYTTHPISSISFFDPGTGSYSAGGTTPNSFLIFAASGLPTPALGYLRYTGTDPATPATWDISSLNFTDGTGPVAFSSGEPVQFDDSATGSKLVNITTLVDPSTATFSNNSSNYVLSGSGSITGAASIILSGTGSVTLASSNTYTGGTTLNAGTLVAANASALGAGTLTINGGKLDLAGSSLAISGLNGAAGTITNSGAATSITVSSGAYLGTIKDGVGAIGLTVNAGSSSFSLGGSNTYTGPTLISSGTFQIRSANAIGRASPVTVANGGTLDLNGFSPSLSSLSGGGTITNTNGSPVVLSLKTAGSSNFAGAISDGSSQTSLVYSGTGAQQLTGASTFSGGTTVNSGKLAAYGAQALGTGTVTLNGGTLSLSGAEPVTTLLGNAAVNGTASQSGGVLQVTDGNTSETGSIFSNTRVTVSDSKGFAASFVYQASNPVGASDSWADGTAFVLQNDPRGAAALGGTGSALGYGSDGTSAAITNSAAFAINLYSPYAAQTFVTTGGSTVPGAGNSSNSYLTSGFSPQPQSPSTATSGDLIQVNLNYQGSTLTVLETDLATSQTLTASYSVDLAQALGGQAGGSAQAYLGFTGSTGANVSTQTVSNITFNSDEGYSNAIVARAGSHSIIELTSLSGQANVKVGTLTLAANSSIAITTVNAGSNTHGVLTVAGLSLSGATNAWTSKLDLNNNSLVVQNGSLPDIINQIAEGYSSGTWQGAAGISSSAAAADSQHLTALGTILNTVDGSTPLYGASSSMGTFSGTSPAATDVLIKYTYYGDANLDGKIDGSDYSLIDSGFIARQSGWFHGDFNYDGTVNGSDYTLIDNAFNAQGVVLTDQIATSTARVAVVAVPEPASIGLLLIVGSLSFRRRRMNFHR